MDRKKGQGSAVPGEHLTKMQSETEILIPPSAAEEECAKDEAKKRSEYELFVFVYSFIVGSQFIHSVKVAVKPESIPGVWAQG